MSMLDGNSNAIEKYFSCDYTPKNTYSAESEYRRKLGVLEKFCRERTNGSEVEMIIEEADVLEASLISLFLKN